MVSTLGHLYNRDQQQQLMKKALSIVSSAALSLAMLAPGALSAQVAKKATGNFQKSEERSAQVRVPKGQSGQGVVLPQKVKDMLQRIKTRQVNVLSKGLRQPATGLNLRKPSKKAPVQFAQGVKIPTLMGSVIYNDTFTQADPGMYAFTGPLGDRLFNGPDASSGGVELNGVYYCVNYFDFFGMFFITIDAYDVESGEKLGDYSSMDPENIYSGGLTKDPSTGKIYGIGINAAVNGYQLSEVVFNSDYSITNTPIGDIDGLWNSIVCDGQGQLYGISLANDYSATLCKINKSNAAVEVIGATGFSSQYSSSATIDATTGKMYWNVIPDDESAYISEVNLETGVATPLFQLELNDQIVGMYVGAPAAEEGAPDAVTDLSANFANGSLTGTISFACPETTYDGNPAEGDLTFMVTANNEVVSEGACAYGANVNTEVTLPSAGVYNFVVTVANEVGTSPKAKVSTFVGNGIPAAPQDVTLEYSDNVMTLSWAPVTGSIDGGYINPEEVTYTVKRYPDQVVVAENTKATSFSEDFTKTDVYKVWFEVYATFAGVNSSIVSSNKVQIGEPQAPYFNAMASEADLDGFTIVDANGDGKTWSVDTGAGATKVTYNGSMDMDDWVITPAIKLNGGQAYKVSFQARANSSNYPERIEAKWGTSATVEGMTNEFVAPKVLVGNQYETLGNYVVIKETGYYYFGLHGISDANMYYLYVKDFDISAPVSNDIPGEVTDFMVTPDSNGDYSAVVSFKAPEENIVGGVLSNITSIQVKRNGALIKTFENPVVGEAFSFEDTVSEGGDFTYTVQAFNAEGEGPVATATTFIGTAIPAAPTGFNVAEEGNTGKVILTWDAVTTDIDGNPINPAKVGYIVAESGSMGWDPITDPMYETTYTLQAVPEGEQDFVQYAVFAVTDGGQTGAFGPFMAVGQPYDGLMESFAGGQLHYIWGVGPNDGASWSLFTDSSFSDVSSSDLDDGFLGMKYSAEPGISSLFTGKISLEGAVNPGVSFYTYNLGGNSENEFQLYVQEEGAEDWVKLGNPIVINDINPGVNDWVKAVVSLEDYAGKTIQVRFEGITMMYNYTLIDQITVGGMLANDLSVKSVDAPAFVINGAEYNVTVKVVNEGTQTISNGVVHLYSENGDAIASQALGDMTAGASVNVAFSQTMSPVATEPVGFYALVENAGDENFDNNTTETFYVAPKASNLPAVTDLAGECTEDGVALTWSEPDLSAAPAEGALVDFEDANAWAMEYAGWTFVDKDKSPVGGFQGSDLPGIEPGETTASFFVFDSAGDEFNQTFDAHSGTMFLAALFRYDGGTVDDWAISPALSGDAQTISFWAKSYSSDYPEKIEMYYSMNGTDVADFVQVGNTVNPVPADWTEYTFDVPAGAKYFAIRSCATGSFMLMLDDFTFAAAEGTSADLSIVGYDVYRDGVKINAETVEETSYVDATAEPNTEYTYQVVAIYDRGISGPSNVANILTTGINEVLGAVKVYGVKGAVEVAGAAGLNVSVVAADGKVMFNGVASDKETVNVPAGVYVVRAGNKTVKVAVK